ncbi:MAG: nitrogen fixation protein NifZ [Actinomycetota bacterium]|nr:nitrogen fixation protein NifZ [Actinomycetota bacterium]
MTDKDPKPAYAIGQYVELYPTIPSDRGGSSVVGGTRGVVRDIELTQPNDDIYLVEFLSSERVTGETAWLQEIDLFPA